MRKMYFPAKKSKCGIAESCGGVYSMRKGKQTGTGKMRGRYEQAKFRVVAHELEQCIRCGGIRKGESFLTREEIADRYHISPLTAFRTLKYLEETGFISCGRGRRAKVVRGHDLPGDGAASNRQIVLLEKEDGPGTPCREIEWLRTYLVNRLRNDGQIPVRVTIPSRGGPLPEGDGFLTLETREGMPEDFFRQLTETGKPFCELSCRHPAENTAFLMPQLALGQAALYFMRKRIGHLIFLSGAPSPLDELFRDSQKLLLPQYGRDFFTVTLGDPASVACLRERMSSRLQKGRCAVIVLNRLICEFLCEEMPRLPKTLRENLIPVGISTVALCGSGFISVSRLPYPVLNLDLPAFAAGFLTMLYRQFETHLPEPGMLHPLTFAEKPFPLP